jgi:hypothetical protein
MLSIADLEKTAQNNPSFIKELNADVQKTVRGGDALGSLLSSAAGAATSYVISGGDGIATAQGAGGAAAVGSYIPVTSPATAAAAVVAGGGVGTYFGVQSITSTPMVKSSPSPVVSSAIPTTRGPNVITR